VVCFIFSVGVKRMFGYDDSLDVFGVHAVGGIVGALATGILVNPELGGSGILDYTSKPGEAVVAAYDLAFQMTAQGKAVLLTVVWCTVVSTVLYLLVGLIFGLRRSEEGEREGLDIIDHGEKAYNY
jgi:ammonium transporter, Amt family